MESDYQKEDDVLTLEEIAMDLPRLTTVSSPEESCESPTQEAPIPPKEPPVPPPLTKKEMKNLIEQTFTTNKNKNKNIDPPVMSFQQLKQKLSACVITKQKEDIAVANLFLEVLIELCKADGFLRTFCSNRREAVSLVQLLSRIEATGLPQFRELLRRVKECDQQTCMLRNMVVNIFKRFVFLQ